MISNNTPSLASPLPMSACALVLTIALSVIVRASAAPLTAIGEGMRAPGARRVAFSNGAPAARASSLAYVASGDVLRSIALGAAPELNTIANVSDVGPCESVFAYESGKRGLGDDARTRLAVTCARANAFLIYAVRADGKSAERLFALTGVNRIARPRDVVVVNDTLAFVASGTHARVVALKLDPSEKAEPSLLASTFQLSGADALELGPSSRQTIRVLSGGVRRVTTLKYTPAGTLQLVGSVKDSRLQGTSGSCVGVGSSERTFTYIVSPVYGGTFAIFNSTQYGAPEYLSGIHADGKNLGFAESPGIYEELRDAKDVSVHENDAYISAKSIGAILVVDITNPSEPVMREKLQSASLVGVDRIVVSPNGAFVVAVVNATSDDGASVVIATSDDAVIDKIPKRRKLFQL